MKKFLLAGILVWTPLAITLGVLLWIVGVMDGMFHSVLVGLSAVLPAGAHSVLMRLQHVPGLGVLLLFVLLLLTGVFATNIFGRWMVAQWDRMLSHIPIVKSIYSSVKQVSDTLFSSNGNAFREAVLVQYPRPGCWTIAFVTGRPSGEIARHLPGDYLSIYVPTTPNPTSGFCLMVLRSEVLALNMSVDEALKYVISMGVVGPPEQGSLPAAPARRPVA